MRQRSIRLIRPIPRALGLRPVALAFAVSLAACSTTEGGVVDTEQIHAGAAQAEQAFLSGDPAQVLQVMSEESAERYSARLTAVKDQLAAFGAALKSRELKFSSELYAEYAISSAGKTYSVAFAKVEEGKPWKLIRF